MSKSRKVKVDFDYGIYNKHGIKIPKDRNSLETVPKMGETLDDRKLREMQIFDDIQEVYDTGIIDNVESVEELTDILNETTILSRQYRHIHVELKQLLGEKYPTLYPHYEVRLEALRKYVRSVKDKIRDFRAREQNSDFERLKSSLALEESMLRARTLEPLEFEVTETEKVTAIREIVLSLKQLLESYHNLHSKSKISLSDDFDDMFGTTFDDQIFKIREKIKEGNDMIEKIELNFEIAASEEKKRQEEDISKKLIDEKKFQAKAMLSEIHNRSESLVKKCTKSLQNLSDFQVFELVKDLKSVDIEMREIFGTVTAYSLLASACGDEKDMLLEKAEKLRKSALDARNSYAIDLYTLATSRDVTEEKLKNLNSLEVELEKFQGYDSKIDIYSFKSDFEKLIQPKHQKCFWIDVLKKNYLDGPALTLVDKLEKIEEIWEKLIESYGNVKLLLQTKMSGINKLGNLDEVEGDEKLAHSLARIINVMTELSTLAEKYNLQNKLYVGGGLEKMFTVIGDTRERRFLTKQYENSSSSSSSTDVSPKSEVIAEKETWVALKAFLQKELNVREQLTLNQKSKDCLGMKSSTKNRKLPFTGTVSGSPQLPCHICGKTDHVVSTDHMGLFHVDYFSCPIFVGLSCAKRQEELRKKGLCLQCLNPGAKQKDRNHRCFVSYACPDKVHKRYKKGYHVLVCEEHKNSPENMNLLEKFKNDIFPKRSKDFKDFTKNITLHYHYSFVCQNPPAKTDANVLPDVRDSTIFMFQTISVQGHQIRLFFDSGGTRTVIKQTAADLLESLGLVSDVSRVSRDLHGVGDTVIGCTKGIYTFMLPLRDGCLATFSGICLDKVTATFPNYSLKEVEDDVRDMCLKQGGDTLLEALPRLPKEVGGDVDILIGLTYKKYFPKLVWEDTSGLFISDSSFLSEDGTTGVIGGPHRKFSEIECAQASVTTSFFAHLARSFDAIRETVPGVVSQDQIVEEKLGLRDRSEYYSEQELDGSIQLAQFDDRVHVARKAPKSVKIFDEIEDAGTEISYRCSNCRNCTECKRSTRVDAISIQEELESEILARCVTVDITQGRSVAKLPFLVNPDIRLKPNDRLARKVYDSQVRVLSRKPEDKESAIKFEGKLQELGFVEYLHNLTPAQQDMILNAPTRYVISWFPVWNANSVSTPCRLVFDATRSVSQESSLNNLLAKGANNMNSLIEILIRWTVHKFAYHCDISKMYNRVHLDETHWRFQLYYWDEQLREGVDPLLKVIMTVIYGVRPSGQLAEAALRMTAELTKEMYPLAYKVIMEDIYVDDDCSGNDSEKSRNQTTDQLVLALEKGGFSLKGFTFSGEDPPSHLSEDGVSVSVGGMKWYSKADELTLKGPDLNFGKKDRGRKHSDGLDIPERLTRRDCASKVAEIFDPTGRITPLTSALKLDLNQLTLRNLDWDDCIPDDLRQIWKSNLEMMQEIQHIRFKRAVVPDDAVSTDVELICSGDASSVMVCVGIYARFRRPLGKYSCQLIFGRSKVVPKDMSVPRAELLASSVNAAASHVVKKSLGERVVKSWMLTDSQVALHWIHSTKSKLKMWARNRVIEINRLAEQETWRYVESKQNISDVGTRKGAPVNCVGPDGEWTNGLEWMRGDESDFPLKSAAQVILDDEARTEARREEIVVDFLSCQYFIGHLHIPDEQVPEEVGQRYKYCNYVIDPNKFRFRKVVRILALIFRFLTNFRIYKEKTPNFISNENFNIPDAFSHQDSSYLVTTGRKTKGLQCKPGLVVELPELFIKNSLAYYFKKSTQEVKEFLPKKKYVNISKDINGILYYTGRILPEQRIDQRLSLADVSFDLSEKTFCVPIVDRLSPVAYALSNEIHWYSEDVQHSGIESVFREINTIAYVIGGRKVVKDIKKSCIRCRILRKKRLEVMMGPKHDGNLCIAPAFHSTQVDICGPFDSFSNVNKRAKVKLWFVVFCCSATGAVDIKVMDDYSTDAFILAFIRFSCRYGYPCSLLPDPGSQLVKGCKDMILSFSDIQNRLSVEHGVSFETCPVGAHFVHGKVERKIQTIKLSIEKKLNNNRLSLLQWETLGSQISNTINNLPLGIGNKVADLENLDLLTPNRLLLGRNNSRGPTAPLVLSSDVKKIVEKNKDIFTTWFHAWLVSYVPTLMDAPKWFKNDRHLVEGDVVLFTKSEKEFENLYQYGMVKKTRVGRDGHIREVEVEYVNSNEAARRTTVRHAKDLIVIHPVEELGLSKQLNQLANAME